MYFVDNNSAVPVMPPVKPVSSKTPLYFTEGGNGVPPTWPGPDWFNIFQTELLNILREAGIDPDKANHAQLIAAMKKLFVSTDGGNYPAIFRMKGVETLPTELGAGNLSSLYSAPSPIPSGAIASGWTANWYLNQIICGIIRGGSTGASGFGIDINGTRVFQVDMGGSAYANDVKLATETVVTNGLNSKQTKDQTLTDLSGKNQAQLRTHLQLGDAAQKTIGNGPGQVPDMSVFTQGFTGSGSAFTGFFSLPGGLIVQYGYVGLYGTANVSTINLPLSYADSKFAVMAGSDLAVAGNRVYPWFGARPRSPSQIDLQQSTTTDGYACYWITIGRAS
jgi:hypothetical protein